MENFRNLLFKLESYWVNENVPILNKLNPGLKNAQRSIDEFTGIITEEVWELYSWKNGVNATSGDFIGNLKIFEMGIFLPLDSAINIQKQMANTQFGWDSHMFVLFESGGGDYYIIESNPAWNSYGRIFYHSIGAIEFDRIISKYDSLYTLF